MKPLSEVAPGLLVIQIQIQAVWNCIVMSQYYKQLSKKEIEKNILILISKKKNYEKIHRCNVCRVHILETGAT